MGLLSTAGYYARRTCEGWSPELGWTNNALDLAIFLSYVSIAVMMVTYIRRRHAKFTHPIFWLFGGFVFACSATHLMEVVTWFIPVFNLSTAIKAITALISVVTPMVLLSRLRDILAFPRTPILEGRLDQIKQENLALQNRLATLAHVNADEALATMDTLLRRIAELNRRITDGPPPPQE
jgi:hypothetical protein